MRSQLLHFLVAASVFVGCASTAGKGTGGSGQDRLDVLTSYTLALSKRDYAEAARYLSPADRSRLAGADGTILPEFRERVGAIRLSTLMNNPLIEVTDGLITGIPDVLPVIAVGETDSAAALAADVPEAPETPAVDPSQTDSAVAARARKELKSTATAFFSAVTRRDWNRALGYLDAHERQDFVDARGKIKETARQRLSEADTSGWQALTLKDGKLTGVVLIIPSRAD